MTDLSPLTAEHEALHKRLAEVKTQTSKELVEQFMLEIDRFRNELKKKQHELARQIDELRGHKSFLSLLDDSLKTDHAEAKSVMYGLIQEKKDAMFGRSEVTPPHHVHG